MSGPAAKKSHLATHMTPEMEAMLREEIKKAKDKRKKELEAKFPLPAGSGSALSAGAAPEGYPRPLRPSSGLESKSSPDPVSLSSVRLTPGQPSAMYTMARNAVTAQRMKANESLAARSLPAAPSSLSSASVSTGLPAASAASEAASSLSCR